MKALTESQIGDIMLYYAKGHNLKGISEVLDLPKALVSATIKANGGILKPGKRPNDGTSLKSQTIELWQSGLHSVDLIAKKTGAKRTTTLWYLNNIFGVKTAPPKTELREAVHRLAVSRAGGTERKGQMAAIAKQFGISRSAVYQRLQKELKALTKE